MASFPQLETLLQLEKPPFVTKNWAPAGLPTAFRHRKTDKFAFVEVVFEPKFRDFVGIEGGSLPKMNAPKCRLRAD
jgi:hypothetical protein